MRLAILAIAILSVVSFGGCLGSSGSSVRWSENIAIYAASKDSKLNDDNLYSVGETGPLISEARDEASVAEADKYTQALLEWGKPQTIQRIIVKADPGELEFFDVQYQNDQGNWQTIESVKNNLKPEYKIELKEPVVSRKLRLKVPRQWDSRRITGQKRATRGEGGAPVGSYKKIREIEVYYALPPEEPTTTTTTQ